MKLGSNSLERFGCVTIRSRAATRHPRGAAPTKLTRGRGYRDGGVKITVGDDQWWSGLRCCGRGEHALLLLMGLVLVEYLKQLFFLLVNRLFMHALNSRLHKDFGYSWQYRANLRFNCCAW